MNGNETEAQDRHRDIIIEVSIDSEEWSVDRERVRDILDSLTIEISGSEFYPFESWGVEALDDHRGRISMYVDQEDPAAVDAVARAMGLIKDINRGIGIDAAIVDASGDWWGDRPAIDAEAIVRDTIGHEASEP